MEITVSIHQGNEPVTVMRLKGDVDASNMAEVVSKAQELYNNPARNLILDLSEVPFISSAGIVALHNIALTYSGDPQRTGKDLHPDVTHSSNARKHVKLLSPQPNVDRTLETSGLKLFFKVFSDLETALKSF